MSAYLTNWFNIGIQTRSDSLFRGRYYKWTWMMFYSISVYPGEVFHDEWIIWKVEIISL
jgi:hypothetical protein